jgi:hypothetical protein
MVEPSQIRKEPETYQNTIIAQMNRVAKAAEVVFDGHGPKTRENTLAFEMAIRVLDAFLSPYHQEQDYAKKRKRVLENITWKRVHGYLNSSNTRQLYLLDLLNWLDYQIHLLEEINLLPPKYVIESDIDEPEDEEDENKKDA